MLRSTKIKDNSLLVLCLNQFSIHPVAQAGWMIPKEKKVKINQPATSAMYFNPISYIIKKTKTKNL